MVCRYVSLIGFTLVLAAALLHGVTATTFVVLDIIGWSNPNSNDGVYQTWATGKKFSVGDTLDKTPSAQLIFIIFNFPTGAHDVTKVTKVSYDKCIKAHPVSTVVTGPANVKLTYQGDHYFICTIGTHCTLGQKLAINVTSPGSDITSPAATSITFGGFYVAILSIVLVVLYIR